MNKLLKSLTTFSAGKLDFIVATLFIIVFLRRFLQRGGRCATVVNNISTIKYLTIFNTRSFVLPTVNLVLTTVALLQGPVRGTKKFL